MPKPRRKQPVPASPPREQSHAAIDAQLDQVRRLLHEAADGGEAVDSRVLIHLLVEAQAAAGSARRALWATDEHDPVRLAEVVSRSLRRLRVAAELTQEQVAAYMRRLGFGWERITVAEAESARRRLSLEEMLACGILFGQPVVRLLSAIDPGEAVVLNERDVLTPAKLLELVYGEEALRRLTAAGEDLEDLIPNFEAVAPDPDENVSTWLRGDR